MKQSVAPALTLEARLKRRLRRHLSEVGFVRDSSGELALTEQQGKETIRKLHWHQRREVLRTNREFVNAHFSEFAKEFADGCEIDPRRIKLSLEKVEAGTYESRLFRFSSLTWSIPVSAGFGRRLRYLVRDESTGKLAGLIALGDPVFNLSVRDKLIGWNAQARSLRLANVLDAYVLGALPPYNMLLAGKSVACLVRTREVFDDFASKYGNRPGLISGKTKSAKLLAVTTSSALGRSSVYNRLRLYGTPYFRSIGYTEGWGHFHIPTKLFEDIRVYLRLIGHPYADRHRFGQGPNWRLRTIRVGIESLGFDETTLRHGIRREVFLSELASNATELLHSGLGTPDLTSLRTVKDVSAAAVERWMMPRSITRSDFRSWKRSSLGAMLAVPSSTPEQTSSVAGQNST